MPKTTPRFDARLALRYPSAWEEMTKRILQERPLSTARDMTEYVRQAWANQLERDGLKQTLQNGGAK